MYIPNIPPIIFPAAISASLAMPRAVPQETFHANIESSRTRGPANFALPISAFPKRCRGDGREDGKIPMRLHTTTVQNVPVASRESDERKRRRCERARESGLI